MNRRVAALLVLVLAALTVATSSVASAAPRAGAAKLKACKKGANSKKCRCPKGSKLVKKNHKYRCKKKKPPQQQGDGGSQTTGGDQTGTGGDTTGTGGDPTGTDTGGDNTGTGTQPGGSGAQTQRDDAGYTAALSSSRFGPHNVEGSTGLFTYTYDFCANRSFSFHSEYYNPSFSNTSETYYNGTWELEQGYRVLASQYGPGWAGILLMTENDGSKARIEIDFNDTTGLFNVGTGSHFEGGQYGRSAASC
jgi:hypothetical protein